MRYLMSCSTYHGWPQYLVLDAENDTEALKLANIQLHQTVSDMIPRSVRIEKRNYV